MRVAVQGDGIAARCCARLLVAGGLDVTTERRGRATIPVILIGSTTQKLFRETFEREDLFDDLPAITRRVVAWGPGSEARALPHSAVVVSEQYLLDQLPVEDGGGGGAQWTVYGSRPLPAVCVERHFGARNANAFPVRMREGVDAGACWIESLENGWVFLLPAGKVAGWLLAVGEIGESPLAGSRLVANQIAGIAGEALAFPAHPRVAWPLCGEGWLACGTGALAFDPLGGDGSGNAIRESILAAAVLRSVARGEECGDLLGHYRSRILGGFLRHLEICLTFYETGGGTAWWRAQAQAIREGLEWGRGQWEGEQAKFRLQGFDLERI